MIYSTIFLIGVASIALLAYRELSPPSRQSPLPKEEEDLIQPHESENEEIVQLTNDQIVKQRIELATASPGQVRQSLSTRGKIAVDPDKMAHVIPKVPGIVREAKKNIGNQVRAGEVIAILESQEMADLKAAFLAALSREQLASALFTREDSLYQKKISPEQDLLDAKNRWEEARINLKLAKQKLQGFGLTQEEIERIAEKEDYDLRKYEIRAPIDGTVMMRHLTQGEYISPNTTIYEIADLRRVWVETAIYPKDLSHIREGQEVEVINVEDRSKAPATLIYLSPAISHDTIAAKAIASLDNANGQWRPGLFVNVEISTGLLDAPLVVNREAIQRIDGCQCTFVQTSEGFVKREIEIGKSDQNVVEVLSGMAPGEKYVTKNSFLLKAEMKKDTAKDDD